MGPILYRREGGIEKEFINCLIASLKHLIIDFRMQYKNHCTKMLYSEKRYPEVMAQLPEDVRRAAIEITNDMLLDGDVRHHEDLIILIAIQKAQQLIKEKSDLNLGI